MDREQRKGELNEPEVRAIIANAIEQRSQVYIQQCESRIAGFVQRHYSFRGALKIHAHAIGWDMLRVPINIVWSLLNVVLALVSGVAGLFKLRRLQQWIRSVPPGLETDMDRQLSWLIVTELLELPFEQGNKVSNHDGLMTEIVKDPELHGLLNEALDVFAAPSQSLQFKAVLEAKLAEYAATRTASSDLSSNAVLLIASKLALNQASFGALSAGTAVSAVLANSIAVSNFWLGSTLGSYYYALFPVVASARILIAVTVVLVVVLALVSTFIGIVTDPIQAKLGIHERRLRKLVAAIAQDLRGDDSSKFQLHEKYLGRIFDLVDVLSTVGRSI